MSGDGIAFVGGIIASALLLAGVLRSNKSTDKSTDSAAAAAIRAEGSKMLEQAWETRLAAKAERIEQLESDLAEAVKKIEALVAQVTELQRRLNEREGSHGTGVQ